MPTSCTGSTPNDTIARISIAVPIVPEKMWPGTSSSSTINARPSQKKTNARVGSSNVCRNPTNPPIERSTTGVPAVSSVTSWPSPSVTVSPSISSRSASVVGATRSMTPSASACSALMLTASVTNDSATSALRSYSSAIARIEAAASFTALSEPTAPSIPTGVAAPTFVPGAIAAMSHDSRTNDPADAARAPDGAT